jgi:hypothetical protein
VLEKIRGKRVIVGATIAVSLAAVLARCTFVSSAQEKLLKDLQESAEGKSSQTYLGTFDLICFTRSPDIKRELLGEATRLGANFSVALNACEDRTCCQYTSPYGVTVALNKGGKIHCVQVYKFDYWVASDSPTCMSPSKIRVQQVTKETWPREAGRPLFTPGRPQYLISTARE